ncbi:MAG: gliding motility-associated ABC transporter substrate-binding protein GldG [Cryomorphaceae bacterium]|mgnify:CR=1 FL=1|nr:gliding motility-associated ABC transporter substrate-binding protein GldG [Cryomorphaceae bacterium]
MSRKVHDLLTLAGISLLVMAAMGISRFAFLRFDLTEDQRFSLNESTLSLIDQVEDPMLITLYLDGDFPSGFQRLREETRRMLDEFRARNGNIQYVFINPSENPDPQARRDTYQQLKNAGLNAVQIEVEEADGVRQQQVFPGAIATYREREWSLSLLLEQFATAPEAQINASIQNLEYTLASALKGLTSTHRPTLAILEGHGELNAIETASWEMSAAKAYDVERFNLREFPLDTLLGQPDLSLQVRRLNSYDLIVLAKPRASFSDLDRWLIDQYLMNNGRAIVMLDAVYAEMDSLSYAPEFLAYPILDALGLGDQLFSYGARVTTTLLQDMVCAGVNDRRSVRPWVYFPLFLPQTEHPIARNLNAVRMEFATTLDTVRAPGVKKTPLLMSSPYARRQATPGSVSLATLYAEPNPADFREKNLTTALLLEGPLPSFYAHRISPKTDVAAPKSAASDAKLLVISDGDFMKNQRNVVRADLPRGAPLPLGFDQFTGQQFGNADFLLNALEYMLDGTSLIAVRGRDVTLRLLDSPRANKNRALWQWGNALGPILLTFLAGFTYRRLRRRHFTKPSHAL